MPDGSTVPPDVNRASELCLQLSLSGDSGTPGRRGGEGGRYVTEMLKGHCKRREGFPWPC